MAFSKWIDLLISEKGYDLEQRFHVDGPSGENSIPLGCVVEGMKDAPASEKKAIKNMLVRIDFANGDCLDFFRHCAGALAI